MSSSKPSPPGADAHLAVPSPAIRSVVSVWLVMHFALVGISLTAVVAASLLQAELLRFAAPYLTPLQLRVDGRPIYLTHGEGDHQPHRVEWLPAGSSDWQAGAIPGSRGSERARRHFRYAEAIATAAQREDTTSATLLALPLVDQAMRDAETAPGETAPPERIRVVRLGLDADSLLPIRDPEKLTQWEAAIVPQSESGTRESGTQESGTQGSGDEESGEAARNWALVTLAGRRLNAPPGPSEPHADEEQASEVAP